MYIHIYVYIYIYVYTYIYIHLVRRESDHCASQKHTGCFQQSSNQPHTRARCVPRSNPSLQLQMQALHLLPSPEKIALRFQAGNQLLWN